MIRRPPRSTQSRSSAASDVYKRQLLTYVGKPSHLCGMAYPHRWSPVSYKSSAGQRKHIGQRPILYQLGSTAMRCGCAGLVQPWPGVRVGRVLCEVRRARLQAPSVLPPRAAEQRRARTGRRPVPDALQLRLLCLACTRTQARIPPYRPRFLLWGDEQ